MSVESAAPALGIGRFVVPAPRPRRDPQLAIGLRLSDRPLVTPGQRVELGQLLVERYREQEVVELTTTAAIIGMRPGGILDRAPANPRGRRGARTTATTVRARLIEHGRDGISRLAAGREELNVIAPASGTVVGLTPGRLDLRCDGVGIEGLIGWGRPAGGRLVIAASGPDAETRASGIDVTVAGAILVVGARIDIEALSRARALGVGAIIVGGIGGRDMRQLEESEARRQAALHAAAPFAMLVMGGYGRTAIPGHVWDMLVAADGRPAGVLPSTRTLIVGGDPEPVLAASARPPGSVRIVSGEWREREGRLVGLTGPRRWADGGYQPGGFVELTGDGGRTERIGLPLSILERLA
jgi:hypothetical protein